MVKSPVKKKLQFSCNAPSGKGITHHCMNTVPIYDTSEKWSYNAIFHIGVQHVSLWGNATSTTIFG